MATEATTIRLGLALGNVAGGDHAAMRDYLEASGWLFLDPDEIAERVRRLAKTGYANDQAIIVAKILERSRTDAT